MSGAYRPIPIKLLAIGFAVMISVGGLVLSLPVCSADGKAAPFMDSLFTSVSASCVTGLSLHDTYSQWSFFGQLVILLLIQTGGLGFMGLSMAFALLAGSRLTIFQRFTLMESMGSLSIGTVTKVLRCMFFCTLFFETLGTALLSLRFIPLLGLRQGLWFSLFHAVSAYCNAGFDLMGVFRPGSSLSLFAGDWLMILTVSLLILAGGTGFLVLSDILDHKTKFRKYTLHSKIVIVFTAALTLTGSVFFYFLEKDASLSGMTLPEKWLNALFLSVTPRTAGFASIDYAQLTAPGKLLTMIFMFIGAGPGSTGGGIKVTSFAVILLCVKAYALGKDSLSIFRRRLPAETMERAFSNISFYLMAVLACLFVLLSAEPGLTPEDCIFESLSAMGTVGLSTGITGSLRKPSLIGLMILMYLGRLGSMAVVTAVTRRRMPSKAVYPKENILIG